MMIIPVVQNKFNAVPKANSINTKENCPDVTKHEGRGCTS